MVNWPAKAQPPTGSTFWLPMPSVPGRRRPVSITPARCPFPGQVRGALSRVRIPRRSPFRGRFADRLRPVGQGHAKLSSRSRTGTCRRQVGGPLLDILRSGGLAGSIFDAAGQDRSDRRYRLHGTRPVHRRRTGRPIGFAGFLSDVKSHKRAVRSRLLLTRRPGPAKPTRVTSAVCPYLAHT